MNVRAGVLVGCVALASWLPFGCGGRHDAPPPGQSQKPVGPGSDGGTDAGVDAGTDGGQDGGAPDAGMDAGVDAGTDAGTDAGADAGLDAGTDGGVLDGGEDGGTQPTGPGYDEPIPATVTELAPRDGFRLFSFTHADGSPVTVNGITADEGGNLWVAGGTDGLFLLRSGATQWEQLTRKDGLHPYGFDVNGDDLPGPYYLEVLSVAGGPAGTVFVGYRGRPLPGTDPDADTCENNWDTTDPARDPKDPTIYQSGDADRVTLGASGGISVVHYDIFSGAGVVGGELNGRERLCSVYRVLYDAPTHSVWFGANHGFAYGNPTFPGLKQTGCVGANFGATDQCKGVTEHIHPLLGDTSGHLLSFRYYGLAQGTNGLWVGGWDRSVHYDFGNAGAGFWSYEGVQGNPANWIDVYPDAKPNYEGPGDEVVDAITSVAAMPDGSAWFGSLIWGAARLDSSGSVIQHLNTSSGLLDNHVTATAADPSGRGVWFGYNYGGLSRYDGGFQHFSWETFGMDQVSHRLTDLYSDRAGKRLLLSFANGLVGIYSEQN